MAYRLMTIGSKLARDEFVTEALRHVETVLAGDRPTGQTLRIIEALKSMRPTSPVRVVSSNRVDYLGRVQMAAQMAWRCRHGRGTVGVENDASASVETPLGLLSATTYRREWKNGNQSWSTEYALAGEPITIRDIRAAGLAQRPTIRNRQRREK